MSQTKIEWADETWSPITGCTLISEGCGNCYAYRMAKRLAGRHGYPKTQPFNVKIHRNRLTRKHSPMSMRKGKRIFVCSMGDIFHQDVKDEWLDMVFNIMYLANWHFYFILTKRPKRMRTYLIDLSNRTNRMISELFPNVAFGIIAENQNEYNNRMPALTNISRVITPQTFVETQMRTQQETGLIRVQRRRY